MGAGIFFLTGKTTSGQENRSLGARIQAIMNRPEFQSARWGMSFYAPNTKQVIYSINSDQLFRPASAVKVFIEGTVFSTLGPDYLFHTPVYRTGPVDGGVLKGDLVLVASGDLLLGGRIQPDGTMALPIPDHTYDLAGGAAPGPGDPLRVIREIADEVAAHGIKSIEGRIMVDASLFREGTADTGIGAGKVAVSPIMVNDNIVDVIATPGSREGEPGSLRVSPQTAYVRVINQTRTTAPDPAPAVRLPQLGPGTLRFVNDVTNADGTHTVTLIGNIPLGSAPELRAYRVPEPVRYAEMVLAEALREKGITANADLLANPDFQTLSGFYKPENKLAEHVSPPLSEAVKVMMKISSNLHTSHAPYLVGAIAGRDKENARKVGNEFQQKLFEQAGLEGPMTNPEDEAAMASMKFSPDFFVKFLTYLSQQSYFAKYLRAFPIMGKDGSLARLQINSPAAGHVYAKTGGGMILAANNAVQVIKALAGYMELPNGRLVIMAEFLEFEASLGSKTIPASDEALGEIATVVYESLAASSR
jgi:D-alanyl-D-alanine carboxypeptidase/D-alanyl-D-alanine-endopeptidase (penicillin-binding protein 4)